jgi:hypothetical protein
MSAKREKVFEINSKRLRASTERFAGGTPAVPANRLID